MLRHRREEEQKMGEAYSFPSGEEAFQKLEKRLQKVKAEAQELPAVDLERMGKFSRVAYSRCMPYKDKLYKTAGFKKIYLEELATRGLALRYLAQRYRLTRLANKELSALQALRPRALQLREGLLLSGEALYTLWPEQEEAKASLDVLKAIRKGKLSHEEIAKDLLDLCIFWRERSTIYPENSVLTEALLEEAESLGETFDTVATLEEQPPSSQEVQEALTQVQKALAYYQEAYEEVRRACLSALYYEDGEDLLPRFLGTGRAPRKAQSGEAAPSDTPQIPHTSENDTSAEMPA